MSAHPYRGITAAFATKHLKEKIITPIFSQLDIKITTANADTDLFGTFTGETPRVGTARQVVLKKARQGISDSGLSFALASEGSIGPDAVTPFILSDIECMAWVDETRKIEIIEFYRSFDIVAARRVISFDDKLDEFLIKADFPNHSLIARAENGGGQIYKGINTKEQLNIALKSLSDHDSRFILESDLRAHHSPSRRRNIAEVGKILLERISNLCIKCKTPGWGAVDNLYGLPCNECDYFEIGAVRGRILGCVSCEYKVEISSDKKFIEPAECRVCNP